MEVFRLIDRGFSHLASRIDEPTLARYRREFSISNLRVQGERNSGNAWLSEQGSATRAHFRNTILTTLVVGAFSFKLDVPWCLIFMSPQYLYGLYLEMDSRHNNLRLKAANQLLK